MMGEIARTVLENGGEVVSVIPKALTGKQVAQASHTSLRVVDSMYARKAMMIELADGFITLPGGVGTLDELFEVLALAQLGIHQKPCGLLNVGGYYNKLLAFLDYAVSQGYLTEKHRSLLLVEESPEVLLDKLNTHKAPVISKESREL